jgi:Pyridoxamine 5'-phosphate oxidase
MRCTPGQDLEAMLQAVIDANSYMTIGTVDEYGLPWVSPVWYLSATAEEVAAGNLDRGIEIFSARSLMQRMRKWTRDDVRSPAPHRLYRAVATEYVVLSPQDQRIPVSLG